MFIHCIYTLEGKSKVVKWGNSFGIRISKERLMRERIMPNQEVSFLLIKKPTRVKDIFGKLKFKTKTEKLLKEVDKDLW